MKISRISQHAIDRAVERFGIKRNLADNWIRTNLNKAKFISETISEDGNPARLFAYDRVVFILEAVENRVITIYKPKAPSEISSKITKLLNRELARFETAERKVERRNTLYKAELEVEIAELNLRLLRARSESKKMALKARIQAIQLRIDELDNEIIEVKREKTAVARGVAAYV